MFFINIFACHNVTNVACLVVHNGIIHALMSYRKPLIRLIYTARVDPGSIISLAFHLLCDPAPVSVIPGYSLAPTTVGGLGSPSSTTSGGVVTLGSSAISGTLFTPGRYAWYCPAIGSACPVGAHDAPWFCAGEYPGGALPQLACGKCPIPLPFPPPTPTRCGASGTVPGAKLPPESISAFPGIMETGLSGPMPWPPASSGTPGSVDANFVAPASFLCKFAPPANSGFAGVGAKASVELL